MGLFEKIRYFLVPRETNGHRPRSLHLSAMGFYIAFLLVFQAGVGVFGRVVPGVLGYASNVTISDLLEYTNERRLAAGVEALVFNEQLEASARRKAEDMFSSQYWAHSSPTGRDPWSFFLNEGYNYLFAGENLARDFGDSRSVVAAWMSSATHRENLLNPRYREVAFAVVNGKYGGYETTLVVQHFGARPAGLGSIEGGESVVEKASGVSPKESALILPSRTLMSQTAKLVAKIDPYLLTRSVSMVIVVFLLGVLFADLVVARWKRVERRVGHNFSHILLLLVVISAMSLIGRGAIL